MEETIVESFLNASADVFQNMLCTTFKPGTVGYEVKPSNGDDIMVLIGLTGSFSGNVIISFTKELAYRFVATMTMMPEVTEIDELAQSAVCELCNMIMGNAATVLSTQGVAIDITPPTYLTGRNIQFKVEQAKLVNLPLLFEEGGSLEFYISYKQK